MPRPALVTPPTDAATRERLLERRAALAAEYGRVLGHGRADRLYAAIAALDARIAALDTPLALPRS